jgi:hypothetical protein
MGLGISAPRVGDSIKSKNDYNFGMANHKINCSQLSQAI